MYSLPVLGSVASAQISSYVMPGERHLWGADRMLLSGTNVMAVPDQRGSLNMSSGSTKPTLSSIKGFPAWNVPNGGFLFSDFAGSETLQSGTIMAVVQFTSLNVGQAQCILTGGTNSAIILYEVTSITRGRREPTGSFDLSASSPGTAPTVLVFTWDQLGGLMYQDGSQIGTVTSGVTTPAISRWTIGIGGDLASSGCINVRMAEVRVGDKSLSPNEMAKLFAYTDRYGL